jgi:O-antigen/teichoic acid export membrane protein
MKLTEIKRNAIINVLGWLVPTLVLLILTPIMIHYLGTDAFGVVVMIQILTGYMTILNFGFSEAIIKQVAENAVPNPDRAMRTFWVGLALFSAAGMLGALALFGLAPWLTYDLLNIPEELHDGTVTALRIGAVVFFAQMIAEFFRGAAIGWNRFAIPNVSRIVRIAISAVLIVIALAAGGGLAEVMFATLAGLAIGLLLNIAWMQREVAMYRVGHGYAGVFRELFHFSKHILSSRLANMLASKLSQLMLGTLSSIANVALYEVPVRVAVAGSAMLNRVMQVFYPGFSAMDKQRDLGRICDIYFSVTSIQLFLTAPVLVAVLLEGPSLIALWINEEFAEGSRGIISIIAITYFISSLTNLPTFAAMSFNYPNLVSRYSLVRMSIVLLTVYPLVEYCGVVGAALVLFLAELPAFLLIYEATWRIFRLNFFRRLSGPLLKHVILGGISYFGYELFYRPSPWYHPAAVLGVVAAYYVVALLWCTTSPADNRRILKLVTAWK